jgi:hypothetical protein
MKTNQDAVAFFGTWEAALLYCAVTEAVLPRHTIVSVCQTQWKVWQSMHTAVVEPTHEPLWLVNAGSHTSGVPSAGRHCISTTPSDSTCEQVGGFFGMIFFLFFFFE